MRSNLVKDVTFVIAARKNSKRVKNKNIRKFGNSSLIKIKLFQVRNLFKKGNIFLSSDCKKSLYIGKKYNAIIDQRNKKFATSSIPMREVYRYLAKKVKTKYVCYVQCTSPFLKNSSLKKALNIFSKYKQNYDSLASVSVLQEYMWYKGKAINYNPKNHPRSQDLKKIYALNFAICIVKTEYMKKFGRIVGDNFYPFVLKFPEDLDIDDMWQFNLGELIFKNKKKLFSNVY